MDLVGSGSEFHIYTIQFDINWRNKWNGDANILTFGTPLKNEWRLEAQNLAIPMIYSTTSGFQ